MNFTDFTDDDLLVIFAKLPMEYRLTTVPLVCRRWAQLQMVGRKTTTSLTLVTGDNSDANLRDFSTPFHLVETKLTEKLDLLRLSSSDTDTVERLHTELPNIHRLTIVQLCQGRPKTFPPELLPIVKHYAGQLTSFAFHYQDDVGGHIYRSTYEQLTAVSVDFQRLLSLINYQMPLLRHLLLNSERGFTFESPAFVSLPSSLYLPVLRQLHNFSFYSKKDVNTLFGSLVRFGSRNSQLKVRLADILFSGTPLWKADLVSSKLDYLHLYTYNLGQRLPYHISFENIQYLDICLGDKIDDLLSFFIVFPTRFPSLTTLSLSWKKLVNALPVDLPSMPSVTRLELTWDFKTKRKRCRTILKLNEVFPALRHLTIGHFTISSPNSTSDPKHVCDLASIRQVLWPLKFPPPGGALKQIAVICGDKQLDLKLEDL